jgi:hypothetical protein
MSTKIDTIDIDDYRMDVEPYEPPPIKKKTKKRRHYEPGKWFIADMPGDWIAEAAKLPGRALHVAVTIMYVYGMKRGHEVVLTRYHFNRFHIARGPTKRGLDALQKAGLIKYTKVGHKTKITVIPIET